MTATDFHLLQPADHVLKVCQRTGRKLAQAPRQTGTTDAGLVVVWRINDGHELTFERRYGRLGLGTLQYRIVRIVKDSETIATLEGGQKSERA